MNIKRRFHTDALVEWVSQGPRVCYIDDGLTAEEQAALDADRAAETTQVEEDAGAATPAPAAIDDVGATPDGTVDGGTDGQATQRQGMVPHAALHEERTKRQETERQLAEEKRLRQITEERTNLILQRFAAPQPATQAQPSAPEIPSFDQDPAGHILGLQRQQGAILGELVQAVTGQSRQNEAADSMRQMTTRAAAMEREFASANPDYDKASSHLFEMRRQELVAAGWTDPAEIQTMMVNEATGLAARAMQQGRNPAAVVYELAKLRGYTAAPAPAINGTVDPAEQLRTIERGQQQARSVGNLRGAGPEQMTATKLADLEPDEFMKWMERKEGRAFMGE